MSMIPAATLAANQVVKTVTKAERELLTHSRVQCAKTCLKKHWFAYELRLRKIRQSEPLSRGGAFHAGKEAFNKATGTFEERKAAGMKVISDVYSKFPKWCITDEDKWLWMCQGVLVAAVYFVHCDRYREYDYTIHATEFVYRHPLTNPETGGRSQTWDCGGMIDNVVTLWGLLGVEEYKTTTNDISVNSDYWKRLRIDSQISNYYLAVRGQGMQPDTVFYNVVHMPALRPHRATPAESRKYKKDGTLYASQRDVDETPEEYGFRVYEALVADPDKYFRVEQIARLESDLEEHKADVWAWGEILRDAKRKGQWPRNAGACLTYYGQCEYFGLCTGGWEPDQGVPEGFEVLDTQHPELEDSHA